MGISSDAGEATGNFVAGTATGLIKNAVMIPLKALGRATGFIRTEEVTRCYTSFSFILINFFIIITLVMYICSIGLFYKDIPDSDTSKDLLRDFSILGSGLTLALWIVFRVDANHKYEISKGKKDDGTGSYALNSMLILIILSLGASIVLSVKASESKGSTTPDIVKDIFGYGLLASNVILLFLWLFYIRSAKIKEVNECRGKDRSKESGKKAGQNAAEAGQNAAKVRHEASSQKEREKEFQGNLWELHSEVDDFIKQNPPTQSNLNKAEDLLLNFRKKASGAFEGSEFEKSKNNHIDDLFNKIKKWENPDTGLVEEALSGNQASVEKIAQKYHETEDRAKEAEDRAKEAEEAAISAEAAEAAAKAEAEAAKAEAEAKAKAAAVAAAEERAKAEAEAAAAKAEAKAKEEAAEAAAAEAAAALQEEAAAAEKAAEAVKEAAAAEKTGKSLLRDIGQKRAEGDEKEEESFTNSDKQKMIDKIKERLEKCSLEEKILRNNIFKKAQYKEAVKCKIESEIEMNKLLGEHTDEHYDIVNESVSELTQGVEMSNPAVDQLETVTHASHTANEELAKEMTYKQRVSCWKIGLYNDLLDYEKDKKSKSFIYKTWMENHNKKLIDQLKMNLSQKKITKEIHDEYIEDIPKIKEQVDSDTLSIRREYEECAKQDKIGSEKGAGSKVVNKGLKMLGKKQANVTVDDFEVDTKNCEKVLKELESKIETEQIEVKSCDSQIADIDKNYGVTDPSSVLNGCGNYDLAKSYKEQKTIRTIIKEQNKNDDKQDRIRAKRVEQQAEQAKKQAEQAKKQAEQAKKQASEQGKSKSRFSIGAAKKAASLAKKAAKKISPGRK